MKIASFLGAPPQPGGPGGGTLYSMAQGVAISRWMVVLCGFLASVVLLAGCVRYEDLAQRSPVRLAGFERDCAPGSLFEYAGARSQLLQAVSDSKLLTGRWVVEACRNAGGTAVVFLIADPKVSRSRSLQSELETVTTLVVAWPAPSGVRVVSVGLAPQQLTVVEVGGSGAVLRDRGIANRYIKVDFESQAVTEFSGPSEQYDAAITLVGRVPTLEYVGVDGVRRVELVPGKSDPNIRQMILQELENRAVLALSRPGAPTGTWFWTRIEKRVVGVNAENGSLAAFTDVDRVLFCSNRLLVLRNIDNRVLVYRENAQSQWLAVGDLPSAVHEVGECSVDGRWLAVSFPNGLYQLVGARWNWMLFYADDEGVEPKVFGEYDTPLSSSLNPMWMSR